MPSEKTWTNIKVIITVTPVSCHSASTEKTLADIKVILTVRPVSCRFVPTENTQTNIKVILTVTPVSCHYATAEKTWTNKVILTVTPVMVCKFILFHFSTKSCKHTFDILSVCIIVCMYVPDGLAEWVEHPSFWHYNYKPKSQNRKVMYIIVFDIIKF